MDLHVPKFSAGEFCQLTGTESTRLRDWRRRGFLNFIGQSMGERWVYSQRDVCIFSIAQTFRENGMDLGKSFWAAFCAMAFVLERFTSESSSKFILLSGFASDAKRRMLPARDLADLQKLMDEHGSTTVGDLVDIDALISQLPESVVSSLKGSQ